MFGRLLKAGRLLNFLHFQPRIFSEFIFYQQNKEHCSHFVLIFTSFFFFGGGGLGMGALIQGWVVILKPSLPSG